MGMVEERKDWAAGMDAHAKRMFEMTSNPYYVVASLAATRIGEFKPSEWALEALLAAVESAWWKSREKGDDVSVDAALGLRKLRGKKSLQRSATKADVEVRVFGLVKVIHSCFDVSIPVACEHAYRAIDLHFARDMEASLWRPRESEPWLPSGMSREQFDRIEESEKTRSAQIIARVSDNKIVQAKLSFGDWWTVTHGDRLGYSLDQLIDRYYRAGSKQIFPHGKATEQTALFFKGHSLLLAPEECARAIVLTGCDESKLKCASSVAGLTKRPNFEKFYGSIDAVRQHSALSSVTGPK